MAVISENKSGAEKFDYTLNDGETISLIPIFTNNQKVDLISETDMIPISNSAIIRSFDDDQNNSFDFLKCANFVTEYNDIGYWSLIPSNTYEDIVMRDYIYMYWSGYFDDYYHKIFKNKTARTIIYEQSLIILCSLCNKYPSDFKSSVLNELNQLYNFSNTLSSLNSNVNTETFNDYWKGFIYRRNKLDNIPISEIQNSIIKAQTKIKSIDVSKQPFAMYELNFNKQISLFFNSKGAVLYSQINKTEIYFNNTISIESVKFLKDNSGEYYNLIGTENSKPISYLYDKYLNKIE
jgi:hypothetical protein